MSKSKNNAALVADSISGIRSKVLFSVINDAGGYSSPTEITRAKGNAFPSKTKREDYYKKTTFFVSFCSDFLYICNIKTTIALIKFIILINLTSTFK